MTASELSVIEKIVVLRHRCNARGEELHKMLGTSPQTLSNFINGRVARLPKEATAKITEISGGFICPEDFISCPVLGAGQARNEGEAGKLRENRKRKRSLVDDTQHISNFSGW